MAHHCLRTAILLKLSIGLASLAALEIGKAAQLCGIQSQIFVGGKVIRQSRPQDFYSSRRLVIVQFSRCADCGELEVLHQRVLCTNVFSGNS